MFRQVKLGWWQNCGALYLQFHGSRISTVMDVIQTKFKWLLFATVLKTHKTANKETAVVVSGGII